jgi:hypothetical protein
MLVAMSKGRVIALVAMAAAVAVLLGIFHASVIKTVIAVLVAAVLLRIGYAMVSGLAQEPPAPPEPGLLRKVKITYRCSNCGAEVRMTVAPDEDPEPPRHCLEDMELVAPIE